MLRPEHLITLREVIRVGSFAKAANRLGYTASAVSQQMTALEHELGTLLFERRGHSISPTETATIVARYGEAVLTDIDRVLAVARHTRHRSGAVLRLGLFPSMAALLVPRLQDHLGDDERRGLRINIAEPSQLVAQLGSSGDLDVAIVYQVGQSGLSWPPGLERHWIGVDPYVVAYPRVWGSIPQPPYDVEVFSELPWVLNYPGTGDATVLDTIFSQCGLYPHVVGRCDDHTVTLQIVAAGIAAAPLPEIALRDMPDGIVTLRPPWLNLSRSLTALIRPDAATPHLETTLGAIEHIISRSSEG